MPDGNGLILPNSCKVQPNSAMRRSTFLAARIAAYSTLTLGIWLGGLPLLTLAQIYQPPDRGLPGRREGGGTRGGCLSRQPTLTALMPDTNYGQTTSPYPTWLWYAPAIEAEAAEFVLLDSNGNEVYKATFDIANRPGIISLTLPATSNLPPLSVGEDYHWYFSLICDLNDRSADVYTEGWIQRIEPDTALSRELATADALERPSLYAAAGVWHDAIATLADLRRLQPDAAIVSDRWENLLESVGLEDLADQPFVQCCEQPAAESR
jgi:hypothetical protein